MNQHQFQQRAIGILYRMSLERRGWRSIFRRWVYADEPLRNDAANLLRDYGMVMDYPGDIYRVTD